MTSNLNVLCATSEVENKGIDCTEIRAVYRVGERGRASRAS